MAINQDQIRNIANLSRLQIDEELIPDYQTNLTNILQLVDQLAAVNTDGVSPMAHPLDAVQKLRADEVTETDQREHFQEIAPATDKGHFIVPRVVE